MLEGLICLLVFVIVPLFVVEAFVGWRLLLVEVLRLLLGIRR